MNERRQANEGVKEKGNERINDLNANERMNNRDRQKETEKEMDSLIEETERPAPEITYIYYGFT